MMDKMLLDFLGGERKVQREGYEIRILPASELLSARQETERINDAPETAGLVGNACVLSRAVFVNDRRMFESTEALLGAWSAEKIRQEIGIYRRLSEQVDISCEDGRKLEMLRKKLQGEPMERIRWKVLRAFSVLPSEKRAREMTEGDYLQCALHLLLDREERMEQLCPECRSRRKTTHCPQCGRETSGETEENPAFDVERFEELKRNG